MDYPFVPMLLSRAAFPFDDENYAFEVKYDGVRMTARAAGGEVVLFNRRLNERTRHYPEIVEQVKYLCHRATILDGEIIALSEKGNPDFYRVMKRDRVENPAKSFIREAPVYFMVFDIMEYNGSPLYETEYALRREALETLFARYNSARFNSKTETEQSALSQAHTIPNIKLTDSLRGDGNALFAAAKQEGLEGIVAKRLDSLYYANSRSRDWLKIKIDNYKRPKTTL